MLPVVFLVLLLSQGTRPSESLLLSGSVLTLPVLVLPWPWPGFLTVSLLWSLQTSAPALCSEALALHFRLGEGSRP